MVNIFDFNDFREYLQKYYDAKRLVNPGFSYQMMAQKAGITNRGLIFNIIKGKTKVSRTNCFKLIKGLGLLDKEADFFSHLVDFAQAENEEERTYRLEKIEAARSGNNFSLTPLGKEQFEYLSKWYHSVIRSLIEMFQIGDDFEFLSKKIYPPLSVLHIKNSVELLQRLDIIRKDTTGIYRVTGKNLKVGTDISLMAKNRFHTECTELAKQSVISSPSNLHLISSLTLGISEKTYLKIRDETLKFKDRVLELAHNDDEADCVYQYQLILFPLTTNKLRRT